MFKRLIAVTAVTGALAGTGLITATSAASAAPAAASSSPGTSCPDIIYWAGQCN